MTDDTRLFREAWAITQESCNYPRRGKRTCVREAPACGPCLLVLRIVGFVKRERKLWRGEKGME